MIEIEKSDDVVYGYAIGYNDGLAQGGGGNVSDEWQIPDYWLDLGIPADNELKLLIIKTAPTTTKFKFFTVANFTDDASQVSSGNEITVDWGDGTVETIVMEGNGVAHEYSGGGIVMTNGVQAYIVSIKLNTSGFYYCTDSSSQFEIIAAHIGKDFKLNNSAFFSSLLYYIKCFGWQPEEANIDLSHNNLFNGILRRIDMTTPWKFVPYYMFSGKNIRKFDGSNLETISAYAFQSCTQLTEINAPNATNIGARAFQNCHGLQKITTAENCEIAADAFYYCYLLDDPDLNYLSGI